jgi:hypothetical protein
MDDLISRQAAMDAITARADRCAKNFSTDDPFWEGLVIAKSIIKGLPPVQAATSVQSDRKRGKWILDDDGIPAICSECGTNWMDDYVDSRELYFTGKIPNFCPNCGADMRGEQ